MSRLRKEYLIAMLVLVSGFGCGHVEVTEAGRNVVTKKSDPPENCTEIKTISAEANFLGQGMATAQNKLRNEAADLGGNYLRLDTSGPGALMSGTVFKCP